MDVVDVGTAGHGDVVEGDGEVDAGAVRVGGAEDGAADRRAVAAGEHGHVGGAEGVVGCDGRVGGGGYQAESAEGEEGNGEHCGEDGDEDVDGDVEGSLGYGKRVLRFWI